MSEVHHLRLVSRIAFTNERGYIFSDNIPAYADWLEIKLAKVMIAAQGEGTTSERLEEINKIIG